MIVISPWSKGGWVSSEVFDHTSLIRFIEQRYASQYPGLIESNITPWRRAVAGDLTSTFNFKNPNDAKLRLPSTAAYAPPDTVTHPDYVPPVPPEQTLPVQEPGVRPARAVPYELQVRADTDLTAGALKLGFGNTGKAAAVFQVRSGNSADGPWTYTVGPRADVSDTWAVKAAGRSAYDLSVYGPNGFLRTFKASIASKDSPVLNIRTDYHSDRVAITLNIENHGRAAAHGRIFDAYTNEVTRFVLKPGESFKQRWSLRDSYGWYDFTVELDSDAGFMQQLAGHVETGNDSMSDPAFGAR
jgi:phospholipase C